MSDLDDKPERPAQQDPSAERLAQQARADAAVRSESRKHTRRSFAVAGVAAAAGWGVYKWIDNSEDADMQPAPLRRAMLANASLSRTIFDERALAPTYPVARAENLRVNGNYGLKQNLIAGSWRLQLVGAAEAKSYPQYAADVTGWEYKYDQAASGEDQGHDTKVAPSADTAEKMAPGPMVAGEKLRQERAGRMPRGLEEAGKSFSTLAPSTPGLLLTMDDIVKLPKHELVTQFKCIEGWSQIVYWGGVRMADFIAAFPPNKGADGKLPGMCIWRPPTATTTSVTICRSACIRKRCW